MRVPFEEVVWKVPQKGAEDSAGRIREDPVVYCYQGSPGGLCKPHKTDRCRQVPASHWGRLDGRSMKKTNKRIFATKNLKYTTHFLNQLTAPFGAGFSKILVGRQLGVTVFALFYANSSCTLLFPEFKLAFELQFKFICFQY